MNVLQGAQRLGTPVKIAVKKPPRTKERSRRAKNDLERRLRSGVGRVDFGVYGSAF